MRPHWLLTGLTSLFLLLSLSGCGSSPSKPEVFFPPAQLTEQVPVTEFEGSTNKALLLYIRELQAGWVACNDDKAAIRTWEKSLRAN